MNAVAALGMCASRALQAPYNSNKDLMDVRAALEGCAELHAEMVRANGNPLLWQMIVSIFAFLESLSQ